jgi:hypothetical protein
LINMFLHHVLKLSCLNKRKLLQQYYPKSSKYRPEQQLSISVWKILLIFKNFRWYPRVFSPPSPLRENLGI